MPSLEPRRKHLSHAATNREKRQGCGGENRQDTGHPVGIGAQGHTGAAGRPRPLQLLWEMQPALWGTAASLTLRAWLGVALLFPSPPPCRPPSCPPPPERWSPPAILAHALLMDTTYCLTLGLS